MLWRFRAGAFLSTKKKKKAAKARNQAQPQTPVTASEKESRAFATAGIPSIRSTVTVRTATPTRPGVLYEGRPVLVDPDMTDDDQPRPFTHHRLNVSITEMEECDRCWGRGSRDEAPDEDCHKCKGKGTVERAVEPAGPYIEPTEPGESPSFYTVSLHTFRQLRALASITKPKPVKPAKDGIDIKRVGATGLSRGGSARFQRTSNATLERLLNRTQITVRQYEAAKKLFLDYEDAQIAPGPVSDPSRLKVDGGGAFRDFIPARLDAENRVNEVLSRIKEPGCSMIIDVVLKGQPLIQGQYAPYKLPNEKMRRFQEALDDLVDYYDRKPLF